jgi:hypothetical protein
MVGEVILKEQFSAMEAFLNRELTGIFSIAGERTPFDSWWP